MSWHVLKLDLNSARWMPKLVSIDAQSCEALTSQSLRATIGPLQDNWSLFHYVIGISGILFYNRNVSLQTLELFSAYAWLSNAAASPASRLHSAGSLATNGNQTMSEFPKGDQHKANSNAVSLLGEKKSLIFAKRSRSRAFWNYIFFKILASH